MLLLGGGSTGRFTFFSLSLPLSLHSLLASFTVTEFDPVSVSLMTLYMMKLTPVHVHSHRLHEEDKP